jgi:hypothetical protein
MAGLNWTNAHTSRKSRPKTNPEPRREAPSEAVEDPPFKQEPDSDNEWEKEGSAEEQFPESLDLGEPTEDQHPQQRRSIYFSIGETSQGLQLLWIGVFARTRTNTRIPLSLTA